MPHARLVPPVKLNGRRLGNGRHHAFYRAKGHLCFWLNNQSRQKLQISCQHTTRTSKNPPPGAMGARSALGTTSEKNAHGQSGAFRSHWQGWTGAPFGRTDCGLIRGAGGGAHPHGGEQLRRPGGTPGHPKKRNCDFGCFWLFLVISASNSLIANNLRIT